MKLLMTGPGKGNNIKIWLDYFNSDKEFQYHFISEGKYEFDQSKYSRVHLLHEVKWENTRGKVKNLLQMIWLLLMTKFDIVHIHGMRTIDLAFLYMFFSRGSKKIINIWGEEFIKKAANPGRGLKNFFYRYVLKKSDIILINWWGIYNEFCQTFPQYKSKVRVSPWGINQDILNVSTINTKDTFLQKYGIKDEDIIIGSIRGIVDLNNHHLIIESLNILKNRLDKAIFARVKFIAINGINYTQTYADSLIEQVKGLKLEEQVIIDVKTSLDLAEVMSFHERVDIELFISSSDQLSNTIIEAINKGTFIMLSNIEPYQIFNEKYDLGLDLIPLDHDVIAQKLEEEIKNIANNSPTKTCIIDKVKKEFIFEENIKKVINVYKTIKNEG